MNMLARSNTNQNTGVSAPVTFNDLVKAMFGQLPEMNAGWFHEHSKSALQVEVHDKDVTVKLPFAGCTAKDFQVEIVGDFLTVKATRSTEKKDEKEKHYICRERSVESYEESVRLPVMVKGAETKAKYADGVLTLTVPREEESARKPRAIKVQ